MRESYKKAMNEISLSEEMKKSILENTLKAANNKKKNSKVVYMRRLAGVAACLVVCVFSFHVASEHGMIMPDEVSEQGLSSAPLTSGIAGNESDTDNSGSNIIRDDAAVKNSEGNVVVDNSGINIAQKNDDLDNSQTNIAASVLNPGNEIKNDEMEQGINLGSAFIGNPIQNDLDKEQIEAELGYSVETPSYIPDGYQQSDMALIAGHLVQVTYESESDTICYRMAKGSEDISGDFNSYDNVETVKINDADVTLKGDDSLYYNAAWVDDDASYSIRSDRGLEKEIMTAIVESVR